MAPIEPVEALDQLLRALGILGTQIPPSLDQRAAIFFGVAAETMTVRRVFAEPYEKDDVTVIAGAGHLRRWWARG